MCRYPQFFAANKLYENIKAHLRPEGDGKGGTYFGATGCGKSYTMLFLTRMPVSYTHLDVYKRQSTSFAPNVIGSTTSTTDHKMQGQFFI